MTFHDRNSFLKKAEAYNDLARLQYHLLNSLIKYEWFKANDFTTIESIVRQLVNKLIERDPTNHGIITNYLVKIYQ